MIKHRKRCQLCNTSWRLHKKQLATEARNRKAAKASKEKKLLDHEDLENEFEYNTLQLQNEFEELEGINNQNEAISAEIYKAEEVLRILKNNRASRG